MKMLMFSVCRSLKAKEPPLSFDCDGSQAWIREVLIVKL